LIVAVCSPCVRSWRRDGSDVQALTRGDVGALAEVGRPAANVDNINNTTGGTSSTYTLRRLKRDNPGLAARVASGELLQDMAERGERDIGRGGDRKSQLQAATVKLEDLGIDNSESARFQQIAAVPQKQFDAALAEARIGQLLGEAKD
jgi:hypothetical protein